MKVQLSKNKIIETMKIHEEELNAITEGTNEDTNNEREIDASNNLYVSTDYENKVVSKNSDIPIELLIDNPFNVFSKLEGESKENLIDSIKEQGILTPLIVRQKGQKYEIIAGHNRRDCAKEAGLKTVPCIVRHDVDDVTASILVAESNRQREEVTELEWGRAYRNTLETIKKQREKEVAHGEPVENPEVAHGEPVLEKGKPTSEIVAEKYGLSRGTVQRKIRLTYLTPELYSIYEAHKGKKGNVLTQKLAIAVSYFIREVQNMVAIAIIDKKFINEEIVNELKELIEIKDEISKDDVDGIFNKYKDEIENTKKKKKSKISKYSIPDRYFPSNVTSVKSRTEYILELLAKHSEDF